MQWLHDLWRKEGPGIPKDAPKKNGLALFAEIFAREWWELVKLNLLFILSSLFVITIPAALAAMASVCVALTQDRNVYLLRDYREAFTHHFWRATAWGIGFSAALAIGVLAIGSYAEAAMENLMMAAPLTVSLVVTVFLAVVASHLIVMMTMRDVAPVTLLKLSATAAIIRPLPVLAAFAFVAVLWLAHILFYPVSVFMPATLNFSLGMFAVTFAVHRGAVMVLALPDAGQDRGEPHARDISQHI